ncbi:MAG: LON peptidase substrate-binding domain-containing protein [Verrucomicrobiota bacterium]
MTLPNTVPVMLLPECNVFPRGLLPLYIFEPRYRAMLAQALRTDRLLCVGTLRHCPEGLCPEGDENIHEYSTAAVIRACVEYPDGTSRLVLQGLRRVKFTGWEQRQPFRTARIEPVVSRDSAPEASRCAATSLLKRVLRLMRKNSDLGEQLACRLEALTDPEHLADFVAAHFVTEALARQPLLAMTEISERLTYLEKILPRPAGQQFPA